MEASTEQNRKRRCGGVDSFPQSFGASQAAQPTKTELIEAINHIIKYAFDSYEEPEKHGFEEVTTDGARIRHLN